MSREIGKAIKAARERADLTQEELAKQLTTRGGKPLERTKISSYERGEYVPESRLRPRIAEVLGADEVEIFGHLAVGPERDSVFSRLERVEKKLAAVERVLAGHGLDLTTGSDEGRVEAAVQAARKASRRDEESRQAPQKSRGSRPSKRRPR